MRARDFISVLEPEVQVESQSFDDDDSNTRRTLILSSVSSTGVGGDASASGSVCASGSGSARGSASVRGSASARGRAPSISKSKDKALDGGGDDGGEGG